MEKTKLVEGYFGRDKLITRNDFVARWMEHYGQLYHLAETAGDYKEIRDISHRIAELAGKAWDRIPS